MPIPIPLIAGAASIIGNLIGNRGAKRNQQRADANNVKFFNMQNQYNDPIKQMSRLKKAGLNPNLVYGQSVAGATGNSGSAPAASKAAPYDMDGGAAVQSGLAAYQAEAQVENTNVNTLREMEKLNI